MPHSRGVEHATLRKRCVRFGQSVTLLNEKRGLGDVNDYYDMHRPSLLTASLSLHTAASGCRYCWHPYKEEEEAAAAVASCRLWFSVPTIAVKMLKEGRSDVNDAPSVSFEKKKKKKMLEQTMGACVLVCGCGCGCGCTCVWKNTHTHT